MLPLETVNFLLFDESINLSQKGGRVGPGYLCKRYLVNFVADFQVYHSGL